MILLALFLIAVFALAGYLWGLYSHTQRKSVFRFGYGVGFFFGFALGVGTKVSSYLRRAEK